jgi:predicted esterase
LADRWWKLADKQGFLIAAPNASDPRSWRTPEDGPDFLFDLVEHLAQKEPLDRRRVYLFGHSAGASFALQMALIESEYFAAVAVHAGRLAPDAHPLIDLAKRKSPMLIIIGTRDRFFPLKAVRETRDTLNARGFTLELDEIAGHDHDYYREAERFNKKAWTFLAPNTLDEEPWFESYDFGPR